MTRIVRDPNRSFGRPTIEGRNLRVDIIAEMFRAGDSIATICDLYELTIEQVEAALRYEMQRETKGEQR